MKNLLPIIMVCMTVQLSAQNSGTIIYEEQLDIQPEIQIGGDSTAMTGMEEKMMAMFANMPKQKKELVFTSDASLYQNYKESAPQQFSEESDAMQMMIVMEAPEDVIYTDIGGKKSIEQRDLMGKKFLIDESVEKTEWKLSGEMKEIAGYTCSKAVAEHDSSIVVAWFTPQIPVSTGPMGSGQLPGMILQLEMPDDNLTLTAISVELGDVDASALVAPDKGKKVSRKKFRQIAEEKQREMEALHGGGDGIFIEIDHR